MLGTTLIVVASGGAASTASAASDRSPPAQGPRAQSNTSSPSATDQRSVSDDSPQIDISRIRWVDGVATAPIVGGGQAELTLAPELQDVAKQLLQDARPVEGAVLVTDLRSGRLLVWQAYQRQGKGKNVALELAPSASLFKITTTAALYERANLHPKARVCFDGGHRGVLRKHLQAPPRGVGRCAPFWLALGHSRNAVYAQLATQKLLHSDLVATADEIGFNHEVPFDTFAQFGTAEIPYNDLEFARAATGFVGSKLTPLGAHWLTAAIATQGMAPRLTMIRKAGDYTSPGRRQLVRRLMSATTAYRIVRSMEVTVHSGTSLEAFTAPNGAGYLGSVRVAGKTGTLQETSNSPTTSWFTGFAPSRSPRIAVTVLLQNSEVWRRKANEVARDMLRAYFADQPGVTAPSMN